MSIKNNTASLQQLLDAVNNLPIAGGGEVIPDGSAVTFGYENDAPVEREEKYAVASADLNELGAAVQNACDMESLLTVSEMIAAVEGIKAGGGGGLSFSTGAAGEVKVTPKGTATTIVNLTNLVVTTSATQS